MYSTPNLVEKIIGKYNEGKKNKKKYFRSKFETHHSNMCDLDISFFDKFPTK